MGKRSRPSSHLDAAPENHSNPSTSTDPSHRYRPRRRTKPKSSITSNPLYSGQLLPFEVLLRIFSFLTDAQQLCTAAAVCSTWREAAIDKSLWIHVKATDPITRDRLKKALAETVEYDCATCFDTIGIIPCTNCRPPQNNPSKKRSRSNTPELYGTSCVVDLALRRAGAQLKTLDLSDCFRSHTNPTYHLKNTDLIKLAEQAGSSLERFLACASNAAHGKGFLTLARACAGLRVLHIEGCLSLNTTQVQTICHACPELEDVSFKDCLKFRPRRLDEAFRPLRKNLRRIDVSNTCTESFSLNMFMIHYPQLQMLRAQNCTSLTAIFLPVHPDLIRQCFPSLQSFHVDSTSYALTMAMPLLFLAKNLTSFTANDVPIARELDPLFAGHLPPLRILGLAGQKVTDHHWRYIYSGLRKTLVECDLANCANLTCELLHTDSENFECLDKIFLTKTALTDSTLTNLIAHAPNLTFVEASGCRGVRNRRFRRDPVSYFKDELNSHLE